ncbi:acyltransferase family protein [Pararhodonellum marinum]|uniref:acyltransferase family protein n=1 Tax=Pararhodonellum marinum TaxID=2755358 RepID=UPI00188F83C6|nr:acyltransferase family protein [Pararhodonellum marinum]
MPAPERRYDIDWLRVIAIGLLLIYHIAIGFQPWGVMIAFITNSESWQALLIPMSMLNIWRIPLLFFVSGMGLYFAMGKRNFTQLIMERSRRILLPYVFGMFAIVPIHLLIWRYHYNMDMTYTWDAGHLWFLANIFAYVLALAPVFYLLRSQKSSRIRNLIIKVLSHPMGLLVVAAAMVAESVLLNPIPYELYAKTWHGFSLGLLAFFFGYCFVLAGPGFWKMIQKYRLVFVLMATALFAIRTFYFGIGVPLYLIPIESLAWILSLLAFGSKYLNRPSKALAYLSEAAYPVYILHMIFLYLGSLLIFPMDIAVQLKFVLVLLFTSIGCFAAFEGIRRVKLLRLLFGLRVQKSEKHFGQISPSEDQSSLDRVVLRR